MGATREELVGRQAEAAARVSAARAALEKATTAFDEHERLRAQITAATSELNAKVEQAEANAKENKALRDEIETRVGKAA